MNLYLLSQEENKGYDTYDSVVVCAENKDEAKRMNPGGFYKWDEDYECWMFQYIDGKEKQDIDSSWANNLKNIKCQLIGIADKDIKKGIICASFNAG